AAILLNNDLQSLFPQPHRLYGILLAPNSAYILPETSHQYTEAIASRDTDQLVAVLASVMPPGSDQSLWDLFNEMAEEGEKEWKQFDRLAEEEGVEPHTRKNNRKDKKGKKGKKGKKRQGKHVLYDPDEDHVGHGEKAVGQKDYGEVREEDAGHKDGHMEHEEEHGEERQEEHEEEHGEEREEEHEEEQGGGEEEWKHQWKRNAVSLSDIMVAIGTLREELREELKNVETRINRRFDDVFTALNYDLELLAGNRVVEIVALKGMKVVHSTRPYRRILEFKGIDTILPQCSNVEQLKYTAQDPRLTINSTGKVEIDCFARLLVPGKADLDTPPSSEQNLTSLSTSASADPFSGVAAFEVTRAELATSFGSLKGLKDAKRLRPTNPQVKLLAKLLRLQRQVLLLNRHYRRGDAVVVAGLISPSFDIMKDEEKEKLLAALFADASVVNALPNLHDLYQHAGLYIAGM
ncbi:hypothetical protein HK097_002417, partial [Rhizophlyctis rosea]